MMGQYEGGGFKCRDTDIYSISIITYLGKKMGEDIRKAS